MQSRDSFAPQHASADHIVSFFQKLRLDWLLLRFPPRLVRAVYVFVNGFVTIGMLAVLALVSRNPFVFPSLGPTAYLLFFTLLAGLQVREILSSAMLLASSAVMRHSLPPAPEHCHSESIREFSGQECWQRLFRSQRQARSWFFSTLAIRRPARRR